MGRKKLRWTKDDKLKAIAHSDGILQNVAKWLGCSVAEAKAMLEEDEELGRAFDRQVAVMENLARDAIQMSLLDGDLSTAKWYLDFQFRTNGSGDPKRIEVSFVDDL